MKTLEDINVEKVLRLLFDLIEDQEGVEISFTLREKEKKDED